MAEAIVTTRLFLNFIAVLRGRQQGRLSDMRAGSAVPGCFLRELHARGESEFGVDVGEVGLHGAR
jgi:hypothetical protein